jgi:hypothetical protein
VSHRTLIVIYVAQIGIEEETTEKENYNIWHIIPQKTTLQYLIQRVCSYISITRKASSHKLDQYNINMDKYNNSILFI